MSAVGALKAGYLGKIDKGEFARRLAQRPPNLEGLDLTNLRELIGDAITPQLPGSPNILARANLKNANLRGVDLKGHNLCWSDFSGADIQGAKLNDAQANDTNFSNANLEQANLSHGTFTNANFDGANLSAVEAWKVFMEGASLKGTVLNNANLKEATLRNSEVAGAKFVGANLDGTDLTGVKGETSKTFEGAKNFDKAHTGENKVKGGSTQNDSRVKKFDFGFEGQTLNALEILGITPQTSFNDAKKAKNNLLKEGHHPDKGGNTESAKVINAAWDFYKSKVQK